MSQALTIPQAVEVAKSLRDRGLLAEAVEVCDRILAADAVQAEALHLRGILAYQLGDREGAMRRLRKATRLAAGFATAHSDLGNVLMAEGRIVEAIAEYRQAAQLAPDSPEFHNNLGNACQIAGNLEESVACYRMALSLSPQYAEAHRNLGSALRRLGRITESAACFQAAFALNPGYAEALAQLLQDMKTACDWSRIAEFTGQLVDAVESQAAPVNPFIFLSLDTTPRQQYLCARQWATRHVDNTHTAPPVRRSDVGGRITLGYLSADFQDHATAQLTASLFALHDRERFRVIGYSYGADDGSAMRRRLAAGFDSFVDLEKASHAEAAARIRNDGVDILVDLKGYTRDARPQILALRPAPIQVSYLGYPGTMGTPAVDYIIADRFVIPAGQQEYFSEKVVYLPDCYQVNDPERTIAEPVPSRAECGLPETGFVFCCFNASYKLTPEMFRIWLRLLEAVPGSVLWLLASNREMVRNLRREVEARLPGGAGRLVFAPLLPNPEHLARLRLAGVFLDTLPYNAHTLASDALWAGCPVVTCAGRTFASRVAGSLLHAVGLPELVTESVDDYEVLARELALQPERLSAIRERLRANRTTAPLFDCSRFTRHLEEAYQEMWRTYPHAGVTA